MYRIIPSKKKKFYISDNFIIVFFFSFLALKILRICEKFSLYVYAKYIC